MQYLAHMREQGLVHRTIALRISVITFFSKASGFPDPVQSFLARKAMEGWRQAAPRPPDKRRPVTPAVLRHLGRMLPKVCSSNHEVTLFWAAFVLAFFGAFCCSKQNTESKQDRSRRAGDKLHLHLRQSKMEQLGKGMGVTLHAGRKGTPCPVKCVREFIAICPDCPGPLLMHRDGTYLSRYQFIIVFQACLSKAGLLAHDFGGHSFRIGAATAEAKLALLADRIKAIDRWRSAAF